MTGTVTSAEVTPEIGAEHGLSHDEYAEMLRIMGRTPNLVELGIFSVMWSEHCSYKSSKKWLKTLPTEAPWVICGPGENAGVIDIGDGQAAIFKMESHNHPSFIEPFQGAATGVGGILRDVFTMGARPVANMNALRFGDAGDARTRYLVNGVVGGIGFYGNCIGVPTIGGECEFHRAYNGNNLVNAMTVGVADRDRIFYSAAAGPGNPLVYVGAKTGRDGIHGATMASAEFDDESDEKRPTVQVGDPFTEKLLLEACLELMATDAIVAIQDMGAAGLTSSSFEMASKGDLGVELDLDRVPVRETGMTAYEIMLSESQERMLMVLKPGKEDLARRIFRKWELDLAVIGHLTETGRMVIRKDGRIAADLPIQPLAAASPEYDRPWEETPAQDEIAADSIAPPEDPGDVLLRLVGGPHLSSRRWIWEQYDHMVGADTIGRPGGDAGVVRVHGTNKALAITTDCTPRYCQADPRLGGAQAVAETWRNLTAVGATPLAITDNMNFGNPEKPRIMGQFKGCIDGIREACEALDYPVVSGNVSFYNETNGEAILPTPAIGGVGLLPDLSRRMGAAYGADETLVLVGETKGHLGQSLYLRDILGREEGAPPPVDLSAEKRNGDFVRAAITDGLVTACHDLSDGGFLCALADMAIAARLGARIELANSNVPLVARFFGEDQGRYLVSVKTTEPLMALAKKAKVPVEIVGRTGGAALTLPDQCTISIDRLIEAFETWFPAYMSGS